MLSLLPSLPLLLLLLLLLWLLRALQLATVGSTNSATLIRERCTRCIRSNLQVSNTCRALAETRHLRESPDTLANVAAGRSNFPGRRVMQPCDGTTVRPESASNGSQAHKNAKVKRAHWTGWHLADRDGREDSGRSNDEWRSGSAPAGPTAGTGDTGSSGKVVSDCRSLFGPLEEEAKLLYSGGTSCGSRILLQHSGQMFKGVGMSACAATARARVGDRGA